VAKLGKAVGLQINWTKRFYKKILAFNVFTLIFALPNPKGYIGTGL
jgi:hypothetical protein